MKYIVLQVIEGGLEREIPILFPSFLVHKLVADALIGTEGLENATVVSAGDVEASSFTCNGKSETLNLTSRGDEDRKLINTVDYFHGIK
jgi:hypothetical protein